uniref:Cyclic nucleotide-binding domain-containing protein n=1 Tax=Desulfobacca acetoxidans TaxID=60893 RepID=A0A7C3SHK3_9BACT
MESMEQLLAEHPFLQGLAPQYLSRLASCAEVRQYAAGQFLFREGEEVREFFLVRHGQVAMEIYSARRGPITVQTRQGGDILGWIGLPPPYLWNFDGRAMVITRTIAIRVECLYQLCETDHEIGYTLLKRYVGAMAEHFKSLKLQLVDIIHGL